MCMLCIQSQTGCKGRVRGLRGRPGTREKWNFPLGFTSVEVFPLPSLTPQKTLKRRGGEGGGGGRVGGRCTTFSWRTAPPARRKRTDHRRFATGGRGSLAAGASSGTSKHRIGRYLPVFRPELDSHTSTLKQRRIGVSARFVAARTETGASNVT